MKVLLATRNAHKLEEFRRLCQEAQLTQIEVVGMDEVPPYEELPETGETFSENALIKARQAVEQTGLISLADDSGLTVKALNGMPGVFSARWCGEHGKDKENVRLLLSQMKDVVDDRRQAAFVCSLCIAIPQEMLEGNERAQAVLCPEKIIEKEWAGTIARQTCGENGFGYDPLFLPDGAGDRTAAQMLPEEKNEVSHRGQALRALVPYLDTISTLLA